MQESYQGERYGRAVKIHLCRTNGSLLYHRGSSSGQAIRWPPERACRGERCDQVVKIHSNIPSSPLSSPATNYTYPKLLSLPIQAVACTVLWCGTGVQEPPRFCRGQRIFPQSGTAIYVPGKLIFRFGNYYGHYMRDTTNLEKSI